MKQENPTADLSRFGYREIGMASDLLKAYADQKWHDKGNDHLEDGIQLMMNTNSGNVFLTDEDCNVAMLNEDGYLENWENCNYCGAEDFRSKMELDDDHNCKNCKGK